MIKKILVIGMLLTALIPISTADITVDDALIRSGTDYEDLGYDVSRIVNPYTYTPHAICEAHLPLSFKFDNEISLEKRDLRDFVSTSTVGLRGFKNIDISYYLLVNETYTYQKPTYEVRKEYDKENDTYRDVRYRTGYVEDTDYRYVWKELKNLNGINRKSREPVVIDIRGNYKASTISKEVDIIPTLTVSGKSKTFSKYAWWDSNWIYSNRITINHSQVTGDLTNFPVLINITGHTKLSTEAQSDFDDVVFVSGDNSTQFNHEIIDYDDTAGDLEVFVNVTELSGSTNTTIYMYYGNAACDRQENIHGTWHSYFLCVHHLHNLSDSTSNNRDLTKYGNPTISTDGMAGDCYDFERSNYNEYFAMDLDMNNYETFNIFTWGKPEDDFDDIRPTFYYGDSGHGITIWLHSTDVWNSYMHDGSFGGDLGGGSENLGEWTFDSAGHDGDTTQFHYVCQGNDVDYFSQSVDSPCRDMGSHSGIGRQLPHATRYFDGLIDEVWVTDEDMSEDYTRTLYNSIRNATNGSFFIVYGFSEYEAAELDIRNEIPDNNSKVVELQPIINAKVYEPSGGTMNVYFYNGDDWSLIGSNMSVTNGSYQHRFLDANQLGTRYSWSVNLTNGTAWLNETYYFNTTNININKSMNNTVSCLCCNFTCFDIGSSVGHSFNITFYRNSSSFPTYYKLINYTNISNGTYCFRISGHYNHSMYQPIRSNETYTFYATVLDTETEETYNTHKLTFNTPDDISNCCSTGVTEDNVRHDAWLIGIIIVFATLGLIRRR